MDYSSKPSNRASEDVRFENLEHQGMFYRFSYRRAENAHEPMLLSLQDLEVSRDVLERISALLVPFDVVTELVHLVRTSHTRFWSNSIVLNV